METISTILLSLVIGTVTGKITAAAQGVKATANPGLACSVAATIACFIGMILVQYLYA